MNASISDYTNPIFHPEDGGTDVVSAVPKDLYAITVRNARIQYEDVLTVLCYGSASTINVVVKDFNMTVKTGHIYGLLGASGCGKTSILRAIAGQIQLTAGEIRVFGHRPNTPQSGIPGTTIGYMPQDKGLLEELTIRESLYFYGKVGGISSNSIDVKCDHFEKLLQLPELNRTVRTLSGGQQRRVSLAMALMSSPPILILDEPTVGVDPLLRERIWEYLAKLAKSDGTTVLITTHYIQEATQADTVGLMRHGKLMAEQSPHSLIQCLQCNSLEDVLLKLCSRQSLKERSSTSVENALDSMPSPTVNEGEASTNTNVLVRRKVSSHQRLRVLVWKDNLLMLRHYVTLIIIVVLPTFSTTLLCLAVGNPPKHLKVSIYNEESNCLYIPNGLYLLNPYGDGNNTNCDMPRFLSCRIIRQLQSSEFVEPIISDSRNSAEHDVRRGTSLAAMTFAKNFSSALMKRLLYSSPYDVEEADIDTGTVQVVMDQSDRILSTSLQQEVIAALKRVLWDLDAACNNLKHAKDLPLQFKRPIYGGQDVTYLDSALPGCVTCLVLMFPCVMTLSLVIVGKLQGTMERGLIAGITMSDVMISQFVTGLFPSILITAEAIITPYVAFGRPMVGSYWTMVGITAPLMLSGMLLGFIIALVAETMRGALFTAIGFWLTCLFTSGAVWPIQGAHYLIQPLFWYFPLTLPTEAVRQITLRGWNLDYKSLHLALITIGLWSLVYLATITIYLRFRR